MISLTEGSPNHENEDALLVRQLQSMPESWIGVVADGQGGRSGGGAAAKLACRTFIDSACGESGVSLKHPSTWRNLFELSDTAVNNDAEAGYTTLLGFYIADGYVYGASCGDSAAYLCNAGNQLAALTDGQQKNPQIGSGMTSCTFFSSPLVKPWTLLFMTDGVWKYVGYDRISTLLKTMKGQELADELASAGRLPGSGKFSDDFTYVLLEG